MQLSPKCGMFYKYLIKNYNQERQGLRRHKTQDKSIKKGQLTVRCHPSSIQEEKSDII